MYKVNVITYGSEQYNQTLELRNEVMRKPIGLSIYDQDFTHEKDSLIIGAFEDENLAAVGVMSNKEDVFTVEYLCVDTNIQKSGLGKRLLEQLEQIAAKNGASKICLDARVSAMEFYKKLGYQEYGEIFLMEVAPVDHIKMEKLI